MLPNALAFINSKGGIGRSSGVVAVTTSLAHRVSQAGGRILVVEVDLQGHLLGRYGAAEKSDFGEGLHAAGVSERTEDLYIVSDVRPGLDVIAGGREPLEKLNLHITMSSKFNRFQILETLLAPIHTNYELIVFDTPANLSQLVRASAAASRWIVSPVTHSPDTVAGLIDVGELIADTQEMPTGGVRFLGAYICGIHQKKDAGLLRKTIANVLEVLPDERALFETTIVGSQPAATQLEEAGMSPLELAGRKVQVDEQIQAAKYLEKRKIPKLSDTALKLAQDYEDLVDELLDRMQRDIQGELYG